MKMLCIDKLHVLIPAILLFQINCAAQTQENIPLYETESFLKILSSDTMEGRKSGTEGYLRASEFVEGVLKASGIQPLFGNSYTDSVFVGETLAPNVAGLIPGQSLNEFVVLGAHLDHIGKKNKKIYNGANDNASGVVTLLQVAKYLNSNIHNPRKSVIIVFFTAEEIGLKGSRLFAERLKRRGLKPSYMLNFEMLGQPISEAKKEQGKVFLAGSRYTNLDEKMNGFMEKPFVTKMKKYQMNNVFRRSDNYSFHEVFPACPSYTFITFNGYTNYTHYHKESDTFDKLNVDHLHLLIKKLAKSIAFLVEEDVIITKK